MTSDRSKGVFGLILKYFFLMLKIYKYMNTNIHKYTGKDILVKSSL